MSKEKQITNTAHQRAQIISNYVVGCRKQIISCPFWNVYYMNNICCSNTCPSFHFICAFHLIYAFHWICSWNISYIYLMCFPFDLCCPLDFVLFEYLVNVLLDFLFPLFLFPLLWDDVDGKEKAMPFLRKSESNSVNIRVSRSSSIFPLGCVISFISCRPRSCDWLMVAAQIATMKVERKIWEMCIVWSKMVCE